MNKNIKVLVTYNMFREGFTELEAGYDVTFPPGDRDFTRQEVLDVIEEYDALCSMFNFPVDKELLDRAKKLKIVANYAVGYDNIDVAYAVAAGITVTNTPDPTTAPTANLALALLLDVARRVSECDRKLRRFGMDMKIGVLENLGMPVAGKQLGIVGMGRIGAALSERANACGMSVSYHNRHRRSPATENALKAKYVSFDELIEQSDFISLNAPYTPETHHIISEKELRRMKPTAILINTSRGQLIDEKALVKALQQGWIHGAGLDMFEFGHHPLPELLALENVVLTPHIGTQTMYSRIDMAKAVSNNVIGFFEGDRKISRVTAT